MNEALQLRVHGESHLPALIYLPGLHGDWTLIARFRKALAGEVRFVEVTYPRTTTWTLLDHARALKAILLEQHLTRGWILAESFGSQIAWPLTELAEPEFRIEGLILAGGFARHPWPSMVTVARGFCRWTPLTMVRGVLAGYARVARFQDRGDAALQQSTREFLDRRTEPDRCAGVHRLRLIRESDCRPTARATRLPVYQLCGLFDVTVFWPAVRRWLRRNCPGWRDTRVIRNAEHAVLVTRPTAAARIVLGWMSGAAQKLRVES